jgi:hypothetical protein
VLSTNTTAAQTPSADGVYTFDSSGFTTASGSGVNQSNATYTSWTFRKQPKFFDVVTYTGNGVSDRVISHSLGSAPGAVIIKATNTTGDWWFSHRSVGTSSGDTTALRLNEIVGATNYGIRATTDSATSFTLQGGNSVVYANTTGVTYVAYLFAHDAGGFGLTGTDNVISCGSFTTDSSGNTTVNLGYEPQWMLIKRINAGGQWQLLDTMRGFVVSPTADALLYTNSNAAEIPNAAVGYPTATGYSSVGDASDMDTSSTYIYIAIRRGPMKVPTTGASVFTPISASAPNLVALTTGFPLDAVFLNPQRGTTQSAQVVDILRGIPNSNQYGTGYTLNTAARTTENTSSFSPVVSVNNTGFVGGPSMYSLAIFWAFRRAPRFFDVVCYKGGPTTQAHNLGVVPGLIIIKRRNLALSDWMVWAGDVTKTLKLNSTAAVDTANDFAYWSSTNPTATQFSIGPNGTGEVNNTSSNYVAYLFATCPGVSKIDSYTGTGTTQVINCGFTGGARFVLIKRTDSTGDWYVWDTARGIVSGNDPYLLLNSTAAEVTSTDYIDTASTGFEISSTAPAAINASGGTYIFLAIA